MKVFFSQLKEVRLENETTILVNLRSHVILLHQTLYDILRKLRVSNDELITLDVLKKRLKLSHFVRKNGKKCTNAHVKREKARRKRVIIYITLMFNNFTIENDIIDLGRKK